MQVKQLSLPVSFLTWPAILLEPLTVESSPEIDFLPDHSVTSPLHLNKMSDYLQISNQISNHLSKSPELLNACK